MKGGYSLTDILTLVTAFIAFINAVISLIQVIIKRKKIIRQIWFWVTAILAVSFAGVTWHLWSKEENCSINYKFSFEKSSEGWVQNQKDDLGIISVEQSNENPKTCQYSLKINADLDGNHPNKKKGEAYVQLFSSQNLEGKPIMVWVYVPKEAIGEYDKPNGIQVFVKDNSPEWKGEYGTWWNITKANIDSWQQIILVPGTTPPPGGYMTPGFNPQQIRAIGIKIAIGDGSAATYRGPIYLDDINWQ